MLALARSGEGSGRSVAIISAAFPTVGGKESHEFLVFVKHVLQNFYSYFCSEWCWIFRRDTVLHIFLILKFGGEAVHNVFHKVGLAVASLPQSKFSDFGDF